VEGRYLTLVRQKQPAFSPGKVLNLGEAELLHPRAITRKELNFRTLGDGIQW